MFKEFVPELDEDFLLAMEGLFFFSSENMARVHRSRDCLEPPKLARTALECAKLLSEVGTFFSAEGKNLTSGPSSDEEQVSHVQSLLFSSPDESSDITFEATPFL